MAQKPSTSSGVARTFRRRKQLEHDIEHITQEMYRRNRELADTNQTLSLLRTIDSIVLESPESLKVVCEQIAQSIVAATDIPLMALLTRPTTPGSGLNLYGWSVKGQKLPEDILGKKVPTLHVTNEKWLVSESRGTTVSVSHLSISDIARFLGCSEMTAKS